MNLHLTAPEATDAWPDDPCTDGSYVCRVGSEVSVQLPDGQIGHGQLSWSDDVGFTIDLELPRLNPITGRDDGAYHLTLDTVSLDEARIIQNVLADLLTRFGQIGEQNS